LIFAAQSAPACIAALMVTVPAVLADDDTDSATAGPGDGTAPGHQSHESTANGAIILISFLIVITKPYPFKLAAIEACRDYLIDETIGTKTCPTELRQSG